MPEYDAFGREIGEDTLAGLGGDPAAGAGPAPTPVPADGWTDGASSEPEARPTASFGASTEVPIAPAPGPAPASFSIPGQIPVAGRPKKVRRGSGGFGCLFALLLAGAILVGPIIAIVAFVGDAADTIESVRDDIDEATDGAVAPPVAEQPPAGLGGRSMLRPANLERAIATLRAERGDLGDLTLRADRVNADLVLRRDRTKNVVVTWDGELRDDGPVVDVGIPQETIPWGRIDPAVPARFVRAAARRYDLRAQRIDYVIGEPDAFDGDTLRWLAYFKGGAIVQGDENGRVERRIS